MLGGGFSAGSLSLIFGESGTGKTTLAMQCVVNNVREDKGAIYVDSNNEFSLERLSQIAFEDFDEITPSIIVFSPRSLEEQSELIQHFWGFVTSRIGLIVFDTISSLYSLELSDRRETFRFNREMNRQLAYLLELAREKGVATILTSQVRSNLESENTGEEESIEPLAARLLGFWSDSILCLKPTGIPSIKRAELLSPHQLEDVSDFCLLELTDKGIQDLSEDLQKSKNY